MNELIYSVKYLFQDYLRYHKCGYFNIPEYQRGYKWTTDNVIQLLDDLREFGKNRRRDEFYCLQNITVARETVGGECFINVIDGQQRLTTLFIIICFIQKRLSDKIIDTSTYMLRYSVRTSTDEFLKKEVLTGCLWDHEIDPDAAVSKDQYYIMQVAKAVKEWYEDHRGELYPEIILENLKLIVNEVDPGEEETVFASLNGGKVDLDGADLLRAILITRASKQKYPTILSEETIKQVANEDLDLKIQISVSSQGKIQEYRVKLGVEIDNMSLWWADRDVQDYFEQLLPNKISQNRSFRYREYPIDLLYYAFYEAFKSKFFADAPQGKELNLRIIENGIDANAYAGDNHLELYTKLKELHFTLVDWYKNPEIHNLVGYLMYNYKSELISFEFIYGLWEKSKSKSDFKEKIKRVIRYQLALLYGDFSNSKEILSQIIDGQIIEDVEDKLRNLRNDILNTSSHNWYESHRLSKILPLLDILPRTIEKKGKKEQAVIHLRQKYLKHITSEEDKEHVRSQTREIDKNAKTEEKVNILLEENKKGLNSIGNIVLLNQSINKSFHNDKLILKMVRIYGEHVMDNSNAFIRPHTLDVFMSKLKNIDENGVNEQEVYWSEDDIKRTVKGIDDQLASYFSFPGNITTNFTETQL